MFTRTPVLRMTVVTTWVAAMLTVVPVAQDNALAPTEALHLANEALANGDRTKQAEIVGPFQARARKSNLSAEDELALGELYFLALDPKNSDAIFSKYLDRTDAIGRMAWIRHQQIQFRAFDRHDQTEANLKVFRSRFPVSADDLTYTGQMTGNQAGRYAAAANDAKVVELILEDVKQLPLDLPLRSYRLLGAHFKSFMAVGKGAEARSILEAHRAKLQEVVNAAGGSLEPASVLKKRTFAHRPNRLHADWDTSTADDDPAFSRSRFNAQVAVDRLKELDAMLAGKPPGR